MALPISDIVIGQCYRTAAGQERRVLNIFGADNAKRVRYYSRGGNVDGAWGWPGTKANPPTLEAFAEALDKKIDCPVAAPPPGFDIQGLRTGKKRHDLDRTKYPYSKDGRVTFSVTSETASIVDGDAIFDGRHPNDTIWIVSSAETNGNVIQMELQPL
ncbi:hypothetical protein [Brevundimonas sp.]|uniref:hypothetical protein n=1 Tax=Brevundimonas sp. TaxID=1871086 RepID=UPI0027EC9D3B|nr:hypothetical protein [Brevundimonas sp.]MDQ7812880.1 hypothetical protein [Brevundimonas sp.]